MPLGQRPLQSRKKRRVCLVSESFQRCFGSLAHLRWAAFASSARSRSLHGHNSDCVTTGQIGRLSDERKRDRCCANQWKMNQSSAGLVRSRVVRPRSRGRTHQCGKASCCRPMESQSVSWTLTAINSKPRQQWSPGCEAHLGCGCLRLNRQLGRCRCRWRDIFARGVPAQQKRDRILFRR